MNPNQLFHDAATMAHDAATMARDQAEARHTAPLQSAMLEYPDMSDSERDAVEATEQTRGERLAEKRIDVTGTGSIYFLGMSNNVVAGNDPANKEQIRAWLAGVIDAACAEAVAENDCGQESAFRSIESKLMDTFRRDLAAKIYVAYLGDTSAERALEYCFRRADEFIAELAKNKGEE